MVKDIPERGKPRRHFKKSAGGREDAGDQAGVRKLEVSKRLIPYSVYLSEETHVALKEKARTRQASKVVRDAITMILEGGDQFNSGYKQGVRDAMNTIQNNETARILSVNERKVADYLIDELELLIQED